MRSSVRLFVAMAMGVAFFAGDPPSQPAQSRLEGEYVFVSDSDGGSAGSGARVTIRFDNGTATVKAVKPGQTFSDQGAFSVQGDQLTIQLPQLGIGVSGKPFVLSGPTLVLPFKLFSEGQGTSTWTQSFASAFGAGGGETGEDPNGRGRPGEPGQSGRDGRSGDPGAAGQEGPAGQNGRDGRDGAAAGNGRENPKPGPFAGMTGDWIGKGASSETRFRARGDILILIVKHTTDFFFHLDEQGRIEGEGTVEYDLDRNTQGLDSLVANVRGLMSTLPAAAAPGTLSTATSSVSNNIGAQAQGAAQLQYDATHLKNGKEIRHFTFQGRIEPVTKLDGQGQEWRMVLETTGDFTTPEGKPDNQLVAEWEVNDKKEEKPFPCWSPFLANPGILRRGPGGIWMAEFQEKGTHRNGVKPWEEYAYVWMARQNR